MEDLQALSGKLASLRELRHFPSYVTNNSLSGEVASALGQSIDNLPLLDGLVLANVSSSSLATIVTALQSRPVRKLGLHLHEDIGAGVQNLFSALVQCTSLEVLHLFSPMDLTCATALSSLLTGTNRLSRLSIACEKEFPSGVVPRLLSGLANNNSLKFVEISRLVLDDHTAQSLGSTLGSHPCLLSLDLKLEYISSEMVLDLAKGILKSSTLLYLSLWVGKAWKAFDETELFLALNGNTTLLSLNIFA